MGLRRSDTLYNGKVSNRNLSPSFTSTRPILQRFRGSLKDADTLRDNCYLSILCQPPHLIYCSHLHDKALFPNRSTPEINFGLNTILMNYFLIHAKSSPAKQKAEQ